MKCEKVMCPLASFKLPPVCKIRQTSQTSQPKSNYNDRHHHLVIIELVYMEKEQKGLGSLRSDQTPPMETIFI